MKRKLIYSAVLAALLPAMAGMSHAADTDSSMGQGGMQGHEQMRDSDIYGSDLMTSQERSEYRNRLRSARNQQEKDRIEKDHEERMQQRAKERGVAVPEKPPFSGHRTEEVNPSKGDGANPRPSDNVTPRRPGTTPGADEGMGNTGTRR